MTARKFTPGSVPPPISEIEIEELHSGELTDALIARYLFRQNVIFGHGGNWGYPDGIRSDSISRSLPQYSGFEWQDLENYLGDAWSIVVYMSRNFPWLGWNGPYLTSDNTWAVATRLNERTEIVHESTCPALAVCKAALHFVKSHEHTNDP